MNYQDHRINAKKSILIIKASTLQSVPSINSVTVCLFIFTDDHIIATYRSAATGTSQALLKTAKYKSGPVTPAA